MNSSTDRGERAVCFIGDEKKDYERSLASLEETFEVLFFKEVTDTSMAAALSSILILNPEFLGREVFHQLAGDGPTDRLLVISSNPKAIWCTNQMTKPFDPKHLLNAIQQTFEGKLSSQLLEVMPAEGDAENNDFGSMPFTQSESYHTGEKVFSRTTPTLGEGVITKVGPVLIHVHFPDAPGKLALSAIRCHVTALRKAIDQ